MDLEQFVGESGISADTIKRRLADIAGAVKNEDGTLFFPEGTRYPYEHRKIKTDIEYKYRVILMATKRSRYIDASYLNVSAEMFAAMLRALEAGGYLFDTGNGNPYGANRYITTPKGNRLANERRDKAVALLSQVLPTLLSAGVAIISMV